MQTGAYVAIKFIMDHPSFPREIPYEAAVYAQLEGVRGIPRIHWYGTDQGAHVLVMDRLGPTLEQLKRICRNAFSLKTVLMLADQLVSC